MYSKGFYSISILTLYSILFILLLEVIYTKLLFKNIDILKNNDSKSYKLKKESKTGTMLLSFLAAAIVTASMLPHSSNNNNDNIEQHPIKTTFSTDVDMDDVNKLNVILNDNDCDDALFQEICECLKEDGLSFQTTTNGYDINKDNSTVITIDQEYSSGEDTIIFAPFNNTRIGHSDSLAIAMQSAFDQNGFLMGNIVCSQIGYNDNDEVDFNLPTETEKQIDEGCDTSFVTISFGRQNVSGRWVAKSIENGLARQRYYLDNCDSHTDLIYRASKEDSIDMVSEYFGTDTNQLKSYNKINDSKINDSQAIINPDVVNLEVFDRDSLFEVSGVKTRAY